jgi:hypothetical protein
MDRLFLVRDFLWGGKRPHILGEVDHTRAPMRWIARDYFREIVTPASGSPPVSCIPTGAPTTHQHMSFAGELIKLPPDRLVIRLHDYDIATD